MNDNNINYTPGLTLNSTIIYCYFIITTEFIRITVLMYLILCLFIYFFKLATMFHLI